MASKIVLGVGILFFLAACTQYAFEISPEVFDQSSMAHASGFGTLYVNDFLQGGNHNCDDDAQNCCAAGYHLCSYNEVLHGGREIEMTGSNRTSAPYSVEGDVDLSGGSSDCSGWSTAGRTSRMVCAYNITISCRSVSSGCGFNRYAWCCSR